MKDILVIREERNADELILGFIRSKYDSKIIPFDSKQAEAITSMEGDFLNKVNAVFGM